MRQKILLTFALLLTMTQGAWADDKADYGVLNGEFSVSAGKKVHFSRGNLRAFYNHESVRLRGQRNRQYRYQRKGFLVIDRPVRRSLRMEHILHIIRNL